MRITARRTPPPVTDVVPLEDEAARVLLKVLRQVLILDSCYAEQTSDVGSHSGSLWLSTYVSPLADAVLLPDPLLPESLELFGQGSLRLRGSRYLTFVELFDDHAKDRSRVFVPMRIISMPG